jgi:glyoxylase-like metal-dependent hydrolase (beta-lactamase superfamily II)
MTQEISDSSDIFKPELPEGLYLLDLPQKMEGYHHFISSWFFVDSKGTRILVDPGPASTIPLLLEKLSRITDNVDLVLLTHIHLDHSGGIGHLCQRLKNVKVVAHTNAKKHLKSPGKLWSSSLNTLGHVAKLFGAPIPVNEDLLADYSEIPGITAFETPGHAPHHLSFMASMGGHKLVFIGEAAGLVLQSKIFPQSLYLRVTSPPKFDLTAYRKSILSIKRVVQGGEWLCYAHWGASNDTISRLNLALEQLERWERIIFSSKECPEEEIIERLINEDHLLRGYIELPEDMKIRERTFIKNSLRGFLKFFAENARNSSR